MDSFYYLCWLLAVQVKPGSGGETSAPAAANGANPPADSPGLFGDMTFFWIMLAVMMLVFLFLTPRQQQKEQAQLAEMLDNLKKNDEVVTAGGIVGTVVNLRDGGEYVTIRIDENTNTRMKILKKSVIRVLTDEKKKSD